MPPAITAIAGYVAGNTMGITRTVPNIPTGRTLAKVYLTIKTQKTDADPGVLQKSITTASTASGQITDVGAGSGSLPVGTGKFSFVLSIAETLSLGYLVTYAFDIKLIYDDGDNATLELGTFALVQGVTTTTS